MALLKYFCCMVSVQRGMQITAVYSSIIYIVYICFMVAHYICVEELAATFEYKVLTFSSISLLVLSSTMSVILLGAVCKFERLIETLILVVHTANFCITVYLVITSIAYIQENFEASVEVLRRQDLYIKQLKRQFQVTLPGVAPPPYDAPPPYCFENTESGNPDISEEVCERF